MKHSEFYYKSPLFKDYSLKENLIYNTFNDYAVSYPIRKVDNEIDNIIKHKCELGKKK